MSKIIYSLKDKFNEKLFEESRLVRCNSTINVGDIFYTNKTGLAKCNGDFFDDNLKTDMLFCLKYLGKGRLQELSTGKDIIAIRGYVDYEDMLDDVYPEMNDLFMSSVVVEDWSMPWGEDWEDYLNVYSKEEAIEKLKKMKETINLFPMAFVVFSGNEAYEKNDATDEIYQRYTDEDRKESMKEMFDDSINISINQELLINKKMREFNTILKIKRK